MMMDAKVFGGRCLQSVPCQIRISNSTFYILWNNWLARRPFIEERFAAITGFIWLFFWLSAGRSWHIFFVANLKNPVPCTWRMLYQQLKGWYISWNSRPFTSRHRGLRSIGELLTTCDDYCIYMCVYVCVCMLLLTIILCVYIDGQHMCVCVCVCVYAYV
jgi:hypothetical protein